MNAQEKEARDDLGVDFGALEVESRQGVPHYKPGQHRAWLDSDHAILIYVDAMGHACVIPCERHPQLGHWVTMGVAYRRGTSLAQGWRRLPRNYRLSRAALAALNNAKQLED